VPSLSSQSNFTVNHGPWAEILENWITLESNNSRATRAMKINDNTVTVSKVITSNKKDVSETDLYLLGMIHKKKNRFDNFKEIDLIILIVNIIYK